MIQTKGNVEIIASDAGAVNMYFPRGPVSIEKSSSIYLFLKMKVIRRLHPFTMRKNAYVKVMMMSQQPHWTQHSGSSIKRGRMLIKPAQLRDQIEKSQPYRQLAEADGDF